jgi:hypothetical protein
MGDEDLPDLCDLADFCSVGLCVGRGVTGD